MKIYNIPNLLAFIRLLISPVFFFLLVGRDSDLLSSFDPSWLDFFAAFLFTVASLTDFFDGYIARTFNQITVLGKILDPLADKMLTLAGFIGLLALGRADEWIIYLIITRELFITGLRVSAVEQGLDISASMFGKIKTIFQMLAIGFLIFDWPYGSELLFFAMILTLYSGYEYIRDFFKNVDIKD